MCVQSVEFTPGFINHGWRSMYCTLSVRGPYHGHVCRCDCLVYLCICDMKHWTNTVQLFCETIIARMINFIWDVFKQIAVSPLSENHLVTQPRMWRVCPISLGWKIYFLFPPPPIWRCESQSMTFFWCSFVGLNPPLPWRRSAVEMNCGFNFV